MEKGFFFGCFGRTLLFPAPPASSKTGHNFQRRLLALTAIFPFLAISRCTCSPNLKSKEGPMKLQLKLQWNLLTVYNLPVPADIRVNVGGVADGWSDLSISQWLLSTWFLPQVYCMFGSTHSVNKRKVAEGGFLMLLFLVDSFLCFIWTTVARWAKSAA